MNQGAQAHREAERENYGFEAHFAQITVYIQKVWFWKKIEKTSFLLWGNYECFFSLGTNTALVDDICSF